MYLRKNSIQLGLEDKESSEALTVGSRMLGINTRGEVEPS